MNNSPLPLHHGPLKESNGIKTQQSTSLPTLPALPEPPGLLRSNALGEFTTPKGERLADVGRRIFFRALEKNNQK